MNKCFTQTKDELQERSFNIATTGVKYSKINNTIFYPVTHNSKVSSYSGALNLARRRAAQINREFESTRYGESASVNRGFSDGVGVNLHVSPSLIRKKTQDKELAAQVIEARELQQEDAERAGIEYNDRYAFDEMLEVTQTPASPEGYNYGKTLQNKESVNNYLNRRLNILKNTAVPTEKQGAHKKQIVMMESFQKRLYGDIQQLKKAEPIIENYFNYFNKDLNNINKLISKSKGESPSLENLIIVQNYLNAISLVEETNELEDRFFTKGQNAEAQVHLDKYLKNLRVTKENFQKYSNEYAVKLLTPTEQDVEDGVISEEAVDNLAKLKEILSVESPGWFEQYFLALGESFQGEGDPLEKLAKKMFDDAISKKEKSNELERLEKLQPEIEKILGSMDVPDDYTIIGTKSSKLNYNYVFKRLSTGDTPNRIVSKFSPQWKKLLIDFNKKLKENDKVSREFIDSKKMSNKEYIKAFKNKIEKTEKGRDNMFKALQKEKVEYIDIKSIPEFKDDGKYAEEIAGFLGTVRKVLGWESTALSSVNNSTGTEQEYKKKLLNTIKRGKSDQIAEREYDKIVESQLNNLYEFEQELALEFEVLTEREGVDNFAELSIKSRNKLLDLYYLNSPITFTETYNNTNSNKILKPYFNSKGEEVEVLQASTMEYQSFIPTQEQGYDSQFESQIEDNPTLLEGWNLMYNLQTYNGSNGNYNAKSDVYQDPENILNDYKYSSDNVLSSPWKTLKSTRFINSILDDLSTNVKNSKKKAVLNGVIVTINDMVKQQSRETYNNLTSMGVKNMDASSKSLTGAARSFIEKTITKEIDPNKTIREVVSEATSVNIFKNQNSNYIDGLMKQTTQIQTFKAKKEVEIQTEFLLGLAGNVRKGENRTEKTRRYEAIEHHMNRNIYGRNIRKNWGGKINKVLSVQEREYNAIAKHAIKELKVIESETRDSAIATKVGKQIEQLEKSIENRGNEITTGSLVELFTLKVSIHVGMGYRFTAQMVNKIIGDNAGRQHDGLLWERGTFIKSVRYLRFGSPKNKRLTRSLFKHVGVFQVSSNEIRGVSKVNKVRKGAEKALPLAIVEHTERKIQKPQILSLLSEVLVYKYDESGNKIESSGVLAFDPNSHSNPHPAFEIQNSVFGLSAEYDNEQNRNTWIDKTSQEYADLFGNSGKIPEGIAEINGDYRDSTALLIKEKYAGAKLIMYKTWVSKLLKKLYGNKGIISTLVKEGNAVKTFTTLAATGIAHAALTGAAVPVLATMGALGVYMTVTSRKQHKKKMENNTETVSFLLKELSDLQNYKNFGLGLIGIPLAGTLKAAQRLTDISGKRIISDSAIDWLMNTKGDSTQTKARLSFLLETLGATINLLALNALILQFLKPDDEEEEAYKELSFVERVKQDPDTLIFYMVQNMIDKISKAININSDAFSFLEMLSVGVIEGARKTADEITKALIGDTTVKSGRNKGRNRAAVQIGKNLVPTIPGADIADLGEKDFNLTDFIGKIWQSDKKKYTKEWRSQRATYKDEQRERLKKAHPKWDKERREKWVLKKANNKYPSINIHFNEKGELKKGRTRRVERYAE